MASADPEQVITKLCSLPKQADDSVEVDKKARSLTRSLTRSAASSPLVQLLATHRKRRCCFTTMPVALSQGADMLFVVKSNLLTVRFALTSCLLQRRGVTEPQKSQSPLI